MPKLQRDGVSLFYEEDGRGDPPVLLVHGWCCDHTYLAPQFERFRRGHRVVAVDLRGHGQSDKPEQGYTMAGFADDLAWLCRQLAIARPVVVGHSMGGVIAMELTARHPDLASAVVLLDSPVVPPAGRGEAVTGLMQALRAPDYREVARLIVGSMFLPTDDQTRRERITEGMSSTPQHVMASALESIFACDTEAAAAACKVAVLAISADDPASDFARFRELCPQLTLGQTVGAGHFHQLEVPEQVNAMIERFLAVGTGPPPSA